MFCSGGLDCEVYLWDSERLCSIRKYFEADVNNTQNLSTTGDAASTPEHSELPPISHYDLQELQSYYPARISSQPKNGVYALAMSPCSSSGSVDAHFMIAAGSTDQLVRFYDTRSNSKIGKLRGHKDNIRCLLLSNDGKHCISGSTDGTVKYWDVRTQRCLQTISFSPSNNKDAPHTSIWTLEYDPHDPEQNTVVAGTKDGDVYCLDIKNKKYCTVASLKNVTSFSESSQTSNSVLSTAILPCRTQKNKSSVWIGGVDSNIYEFEYGKALETLSGSTTHRDYDVHLMPSTPKSAASSMSSVDVFSARPSPIISNIENPSTPTTTRSRASSFFVQRNTNVQINIQPHSVIYGHPGIVAHHILNCRTKVLAKDNSGRITLWDITSGKMVQDLGKNCTYMEDEEEDTFERLCKEYTQQKISVRNWFTVEKKLGCLEIVLNPNECFNADNYAYESGFLDAAEEEKVNFGVMIVKALFKNWKEKRMEMRRKSIETTESEENEGENQASEEEIFNKGRTFTLPENTAVIVHHEKTSMEKSPFMKLIRDFDGYEKEYSHIPRWVVGILNGDPPPVNPQSHKLSFYLEPAADEPLLKPLQQNNAKLLASRILRIYKVALHIVTKLQLESQLPTYKELEVLKSQYYEAKLKEHEQNPTVPLVTRETDEAFDDSLKLRPNVNMEEKCRPEEFVEIICYGNRMSNRWNLGIANSFFRPKNVSYITLNYRQRYLIHK